MPSLNIGLMKVDPGTGERNKINRRIAEEGGGAGRTPVTNGEIILTRATGEKKEKDPDPYESPRIVRLCRVARNQQSSS